MRRDRESLSNRRGSVHMRNTRFRCAASTVVTLCLLALSTSEANSQAVGGEPYRFTSKQGWCLDGQYSNWVVRNVCSQGGLETTWSKYSVGQGYFKLVS